MEVKERRRYTEAFRQEAVAQVIEGGRSVSAVARSLEISGRTLWNWVVRARQGEAPTKGIQAPVSDAQAELSRLRQENARLRAERDILKKAAAYFAKESK